jgi:6-phosphogluconolactonase (cycloisomerase 2 family)
MRAIRLTVFALMLLVALRLHAQEPSSPTALTARIERLIRQLDDEKFEVREKAEKDLAAIGEPAREKLTAATKDASFERSQRAAKLLKELRRNSVGLRYLSTVKHEGLAGAVTVAISPDGRFVYGQGFQAHAVNAFRRDEVTGELTHVQTIADPENLAGAVKLRLSEDGKQAVVACYAAKSIGYFTRNEKTGELTQVATFRGNPEVNLQWPVEAVFSADGKRIYAVDDQRAAVVALFAIPARKEIGWSEVFQGEDRCFDGVRGITAHPDGKTLYVSSYRAGTLTVVEGAEDGGKLRVRQVLRGGQDDVRGLPGIIAARVSRDGKFVYTVSGRFGGSEAVSVFRVGDDGKLKVVQEFLNEQGELTDFTGGNQLALSPDETMLYAAGTTSAGLACFRRDAKTGKLEFITTIRNEATGVGDNLGANGIAISPDGRHLYLALEDAGAISVFERAQ